MLAALSLPVIFFQSQKTYRCGAAGTEREGARAGAREGAGRLLRELLVQDEGKEDAGKWLHM